MENQAAAIQDYASTHGFIVVQSYYDSGRSGVALKRRSGLCQLIQDVVGKEARFNAILVYDVSRWGRFQDADEAAHCPTHISPGMPYRGRSRLPFQWSTTLLKKTSIEGRYGHSAGSLV
jgi:hypothetical protein